MTKPREAAKTGTTKRCRRCKVVKNTSEFHRSASRKDGLQSYCRTCKKVIDNEHNQRNPQRNYGRTREYRLRNQRWLYEYLRTKQCEWEGCTVNDPDMLVFDHLNPREKLDHVSTMANGSLDLNSGRNRKVSRAVRQPSTEAHYSAFDYKKWLAED